MILTKRDWIKWIEEKAQSEDKEISEVILKDFNEAVKQYLKSSNEPSFEILKSACQCVDYYLKQQEINERKKLC